jgi:hypothetical protein
MFNVSSADIHFTLVHFYAIYLYIYQFILSHWNKVTMYSDPRTLTFDDTQYRYEVKQLNKESGNGRK